MAVLETLRQKAGIFLVGIIGISLLSFILGDMFGSKGTGLFSSGYSLGEINGTKISYEDYQHKVDYYTGIYHFMYGQNANNEEVAEEMREQAWQSLVRDKVYAREFDRLGMKVSGDELFDLIQGRNISPLVVSHFTNPQTGEFDRGYVLRYIQNLDLNPNPEAKAFWLFLEKEIIYRRLEAKFLGLAARAMYVTDLDAGNAVNNTSGTVNIQLVANPLSSIADSAVKVTSSDIKKFYNENKERYKQTASRDVEYVAFPIVPSDEDDQAAREWIEKLAPEFKATSEVRQFVTLKSDVTFDSKYYKKGELPELLDGFAFSSTKADMLNPVFDDGAYKMARIADSRMLPDSVKARHILLDGRRGLDATRKLADSIRTALRKGAKFADLAEKYSIDNVANEKGGDIGWFTQDIQLKSFSDSCFFMPKGRVMVVETQAGIHVVEVTDKGKEEKKVQLAVVMRELEPSRTTRERIFANANELATTAHDYASFTAKANEKGYTKHTASRITINDRHVQGLQQAREMVRWAFDKKDKDAVSGVFEISNNFVVAVLKEVRKDGYAPIKQVSSEITAEVLRQKKVDAAAAAMKGAADLNDLAEKLGTSVNIADNINFSSFYLPGVGVEPKLVAVASASKENQISAPVKGYSGAYVFTVLARNFNVDEALVAQEKQRMQTAIPMRVGYEVFDAMRTEANIKDLRGKVLF
jgi:peptidyl-prolyl cis-trans isomerase D